MSRKIYPILALFLSVYAVLTLFHPGGLMAYAFPSMCWTIMSLTTLYIAGGLGKIRSWTNAKITLMALLVAVFQIFIITDAGLLNKFGKSPLSFTPTGIAINFTLVSSTILGMELSRAYLTKNLNRKNPTLALAFVTLLYTFTNVSIFPLIHFRGGLIYAKFMGGTVLPTLIENLLATYLALLSGPAASLAYRGPLQAFKWFSPILPDLPWGYQSLIGVMTPTIGFMAINMATSQRDLRKAGILIEKRPTLRQRKIKNSLKGWMVISIFCVLIVWTSTGLLGFYPTLVASGSMRPTMNVGDMAIVVKTSIDEIKTGDIVQYVYEGEMNVHRVYDIQESEGEILFITKGDANPEPDADPVLPAQIRGKLIFTIPKLGWISIYTKTAIASIWSFFSANTILAYAMLTTIASMASIYAIRAYKNRPHRYWQRNRGWIRK